MHRLINLKSDRAVGTPIYAIYGVWVAPHSAEKAGPMGILFARQGWRPRGAHWYLRT